MKKWIKVLLWVIGIALALWGVAVLVIKIGFSNLHFG